MNYTKEEIERYLEILRSYNITSCASTNQAVGEENRKVRCWNCQSDCFFFVESGYKIWGSKKPCFGVL